VCARARKLRKLFGNGKLKAHYCLCEEKLEQEPDIMCNVCVFELPDKDRALCLS